MNTGKRALLTLFVVAGLSALLPGFIYTAGILKVHGRPTPADPTDFDRKSLAAVWMACREKPPMTVQPLNPWGVATRLLLSDLSANPGERTARQIARRHNIANPVGNSTWWHISGAALTIWITRNWSAEQISATAVRDQLCVRRRTVGP